MIGSTLGHYRILDCLGAGGMGVVWLAEDLQLGRKVAIKTLRDDIGATPTQLARFEREARAVASLNHANIVTLYSVEESDGLRFLVMEYVDGARLEDRIPEGGLPPADVLRIGAAIADALAAAHAHGIVHRDLKPGNVLLTPDGRVKVVDFGLARSLQPASGPYALHGGDTTMTHEGHAIGTLHYMSPEQLEGKTLDHRSDLYSLGVVLFEMATGERPFCGDSAVRVISSILRDPPSRIDTRASRLPKQVAALIDRLLVKNVDKRPRSAAEVRDALLEAAPFCSDETAAFAGGSRPARTRTLELARRKPRRKPLALALAAGVVLVAAATALWLARAATVRGGEGQLAAAAAPTKIPSIAVLPLANYSGDPDYFIDGMTDGLIGALAHIDGLRVISRQSTMHYKGSAKRLPEVAAELGVDYVVEASLRRGQGRLRLEAKLFRPEPEEQVWNDAFDRPEPEVLALHADAARAIATSIHVVVPPASGVAAAVAQRVDQAAYLAFLRGKALSEHTRPESLERAQQHFEDALRRQPNFAPAHVGLATVYGLRAYLYEDPVENSARQEAEARRAIAIQPTLAEAHVVLGDHSRYFRWDWRASEASYRRALTLDPSSSAARRGLWGLLASLGRLPEARDELQRAQLLDPLSPGIENNFGYQALFEQQPELARESFERALELDPAFPSANAGLWTLCSTNAQEGDCLPYLVKVISAVGFDELAQELAALPAGTPPRDANAIAGDWLERRSETTRVPIGLGAAILVSAGELDRATAWIERAFEQRDPELVWLAQDPSWSPLLERPALQDLLEKMKLPHRQR